MALSVQKLFCSLIYCLIFVGCGTVVGNGNKTERSGEDAENSKQSDGSPASVEADADVKDNDELSSDKTEKKRQSDGNEGQAGSAADISAQEKHQDLLANFKILFIPGCTMPWDSLTFPIDNTAQYSLRKKGVDSTQVFSLEKDVSYAQGNLFTSTSKTTRIARYAWDSNVTSWDADESLFENTIEIESSFACSEATQTGTSEGGALTNYGLQIDDPDSTEFQLSWSVRNDGNDDASIDKFSVKDIERDEVVLEGFLDE